MKFIDINDRWISKNSNSVQITERKFLVFSYDGLYSITWPNTRLASNLMWPTPVKQNVVNKTVSYSRI